MDIPSPSQRALKTPASPIRRLAGLAHSAEQRGIKVFRLNIGQPDLPSPPEFLDAVTACRQPVVAYEASQGCSHLLRSWSAYINRDYSIGLTENEMLITMGASEALIFAFMACCDPGDEILIFDPTYANYIGFAAISGVRLVPLPCSLEDNFPLPAKEEIERFISPYTKAILICNPNNPTGAVCSDGELERLLEVCREHDLFLIADETYREFVFDGCKPRCIFELAPQDPRIVMVDSLSKRFSLCGARIGCLVTWNKELRQAAFHIAQARLAAPTIEQQAAARMLDTISGDYLRLAHQDYQARRDVAVQAVSKIEGAVVHPPRGGFYVLVKLPIEDADAFASFMLTDFTYEGSTVFVAPASGFYMRREAGRNAIRIAFVLEQADTARAIDVLARGVQAYNSRNQ